MERIFKEALTRCGYPQWTITTVQRKMKTKKEDNIRKKTVEKKKAKAWWYFIYPRIIRNHITDHEEIQCEYSNEASQHHQEVTSKTKGNSRTTKDVRRGVFHNV